ncbi:MAG TPA: DUF4886 domain-containing protein [Planctomycetota bacterium]|jgi:hypothetical protein|nr:DUF4886 domain-containing protein [Planctomycetota bacterium]
MIRTQRFLLLTALCFGALTAAEPATKLRVLVVGNSFSNNALHYLKDIAGAADCTLDVTHLMVGGSPLKLHWGKAEKALKDPQDVEGKYGDGGKTGSLPENLAKGPWDIVTMQQYSKEAHDPATYRPFADQLVALIRERAPQARLCIHQTWAYRLDDPRFGTGPGTDLKDAEEMHRLVRAAYIGVAKELKLDVIPVGEAFHIANSDSMWGFKVDTAWNKKTAEFPSLPEQRHSLNVGWSWSTKDGKKNLAYDGHHANSTGEYLAGCVWFETFYHRSVVGNTYRPKDISAEDATYLQQTAHKAVEAEYPSKQ